MFRARVAGPSRALVRDFARHSGGNPASYSRLVPPHLFPQWTLATMLRAAEDLSYPAWAVINAGCGFEVLGELGYGPFDVTAQVLEVNVGERRTRVTLETTTAPAGGAVALRAQLQVLVSQAAPAGRRSGGSAPRRPPNTPPCVPMDAVELAHGLVPANAGLDFARLTGDFNPIHWAPAAARAVGFRGVVLQGFGSLARCLESVIVSRLGGDVSRLRSVQARFAAPLVLPARVGVYVVGDKFFLGDAPGGAAYVEGQFLCEPAPAVGVSVAAKSE